MKTTIEQWRMLKAVVEHGSFAKAAEAIHKSQSSINTAVHKLQQILGVQLLRVEGRRTILTDEGVLLLRRSNLVLDEVSRIEAIAESLVQGEETILKVAVDAVFPYAPLYSAFQAISARYPHIRVELIETILSGSNELLENGEVSIAITPLAPRQLPVELLCSVNFYAVAAPHHTLFSEPTPLKHEQLKSHRQIVVRDSAILDKKDSGWLGAEQRWTVSTMDTSINLICEGFGYAWLPETKIAQHLDSGALKKLPLERGQVRSTDLFLVVTDEDKLGPVAKQFAQSLRKM